MVENGSDKKWYAKLIEFDPGMASLKRSLILLLLWLLTIGAMLLVYTIYSYINFGRTFSEFCDTTGRYSYEQCECAGSSIKQQINFPDFVYLVFWQQDRLEPESFQTQISDVAVRKCISESNG